MHTGRQLSQIFDSFWEDFGEAVNVVGRVEAAEAEADRGTGTVFITRGRGRPRSEGADYGRGFEGAGGAGGAGRDGDALHVEVDEQSFAFDAVEGDVCDIWEAVFAVAVEGDVWNHLADAIFKRIAEVAEFCRVVDE